MAGPVGPIVKGQTVQEECVRTRRRLKEKLDTDDQKGKQSKSLKLSVTDMYRMRNVGQFCFAHGVHLCAFTALHSE